MSEFRTPAVNMADLSYRCPQCYKYDKIKDFSTLSLMKQHLQEQHGYRSKESGRKSPLTESFQNQLALLEEKLKKAKKEEEQNKYSKGMMAPSRKYAKPNASSIQHRTRLGRVPVSNPPMTRHASAGSSYQSNHLIRHAPQYLAPKIYSPSSIGINPPSNGPQTYVEMKREHDRQNESAQRSKTKSDDKKPQIGSNVDNQADETLSKMLDKTERDLGSLQLQVENNVHPKEAKNMVHTLNTAKTQVENLKKTAEKITGEQQKLIDQLQTQLRNRNSQMKKAKKELENLRDDRNKVRRDLDDKEKKSNQTEEELEIMKKILGEKEERINIKEKELEELSNFVKSASANEEEARNKLENFVTSILDRAQSAEEEVHSLKTQLSLTPLLQSPISTPSMYLNQNISHNFSSPNGTFIPVVHSTPLPSSVNTVPPMSPRMPPETGRATPVNRNHALSSPRIRLSPGQVVANLNGSLVDPQAPSQSSSYSADNTLTSNTQLSQSNACQSSVWSDIEHTPIYSPITQTMHLARCTPFVASPLTLSRHLPTSDETGPTGYSNRTSQINGNLTIHTGGATQSAMPNNGVIFRPIESGPADQEVSEEIIKPVVFKRNQRLQHGNVHFNVVDVNDEEPHVDPKNQYYISPTEDFNKTSDASVQTAPVEVVSENVGTSPLVTSTVKRQQSEQQATFSIVPHSIERGSIDPSRQGIYAVPPVNTAPVYVTNYGQHPVAQVHVVPVTNISVPIPTQTPVYGNFQQVQFHDRNVPFTAPSTVNDQFIPPPTHISQPPIEILPYEEELTGYAPTDDTDVHTWVDSQNKLFPSETSENVHLQPIPDFSVQPFPGYKIPNNDSSATVPSKGRLRGTSDSGIGSSNPSSRATVHGALPNQYYRMATVREDSSTQHSDLSVDEQGILWDNQHYKRNSPPIEHRNWNRGTYPSHSRNGEQLTDNWNRRITEALQVENYELKEQLSRFQKTQQHSRDQQKAPVEERFESETDGLSQESESEFLTAEYTSDIEKSDSHENSYQRKDDVSPDERVTEKPNTSSKEKRQTERKYLVERLLKSKKQRHQDALFCVFIYLDTRSLCVISEVCKDWRDISRHPALWRTLDFTHVRMSSRYLKTISKWCTQLQSLTLEGLRGRRKSLTESNDTYLHHTRGCLEEGFEYLLTASQNTLISLKVIDCGNILTDRCLYLAGCYTRSLQRVVYISDAYPAGPEAIWTLGAGCRDISTLIIPPLFPSQKPQRFDNGCVRRIGKCWPNLRVVCIGGIEVNTRGLISLARSCPRLSVLELDHMSEIGEKEAQALCSAGLKGLEELDFTFTPVTPKAILCFISGCYRLKSVEVHVGISDYFDETSSTKSRQQYKEIILKLNSLLRRPGVKNILRIKTDYG